VRFKLDGQGYVSLHQRNANPHGVRSNDEDAPLRRPTGLRQTGQDDYFVVGQTSLRIPDE